MFGAFEKENITILCIMYNCTLGIVGLKSNCKNNRVNRVTVKNNDNNL